MDFGYYQIFPLTKCIYLEGIANTIYWHILPQGIRRAQKHIFISFEDSNQNSHSWKHAHNSSNIEDTRKISENFFAILNLKITIKNLIGPYINYGVRYRVFKVRLFIYPMIFLFSITLGKWRENE